MQQSFVNKITSILASWGNNQPSIADFFDGFTSLRERKLSLQEEKSHVSSCRIGAALGLSVSFHIGLHGGADVRTYGRTDGSDVITKPKFLALTHFLISLTHGAPL